MARDPFSDAAVPVESLGWVEVPCDEVLAPPPDARPHTSGDADAAHWRGVVSLPAVVIDTRHRSDVADLIRVSASEGVGDLRCGLGADDTGAPEAWRLRLEVLVDHPVVCRFHLVVPWLEWRDWWRSVATAGAVALNLGAVDTSWLVLDVDPRALGPVLDLLEHEAERRRDREDRR